MRDEDPPGDAIHLEALQIMTRIGITEEERAEAQRLAVNLTLWPLAGFEALQDRVEETVDYAVLAQGVSALAAGREDRLIETLAEAIAGYLLGTFRLARVRVEVRKFILPEVDYVAVIITREPGAAS